MQDYPNLVSINPFTQLLFDEHPADRPKTLDTKLENAIRCYKTWRTADLNTRTALCRAIAALLDLEKDQLARLITEEMGKPIAQSRAEIEKCALLCRVFAERSDGWLSPETLDSSERRAYVVNEPIGVILAIMPWNYPFWQVFRCLIPAIALGNTVVLKHASNVSACARAIESLVQRAGAPKHLLTTVFLASDRVADLIADSRIAGVTLTGSEAAGRSVAAAAGAAIKPVVLELGGSNAFIVLPDADLERALDRYIAGRFQNSGQSCIAAKRLLLHDEIADDFVLALNGRMRDFVLGDPLLESTFIGPLARKEFGHELVDIVNRSTTIGARLLHGGRMDGVFFEPTLLSQVNPKHPVFFEETFGPVAAVSTFSSLNQAIELSNESRFGLGVSIFTSNPEQVLQRAHEFEEGAVFINDIVYSDPVLPFGGLKNSGIGRELGRDGLLAFANRKTVVVH